MEMNGTVELPAPQQVVWEKLNDPRTLQACIPGCEALEATEDGGFHATVKIKIGPLAARFNGRVKLEDLDPPTAYNIVGEGDGGVAGSAKGRAAVTLTEIAGGTKLSYVVEAHIGGRLAQLGQRLINGTAKKIAEQFFDRFAMTIAR